MPNCIYFLSEIYVCNKCSARFDPKKKKKVQCEYISIFRLNLAVEDTNFRCHHMIN